MTIEVEEVSFLRKEWMAEMSRCHRALAQAVHGRHHTNLDFNANLSVHGFKIVLNNVPLSVTYSPNSETLWFINHKTNYGFSLDGVALRQGFPELGIDKLLELKTKIDEVLVAETLTT